MHCERLGTNGEFIREYHAWLTGYTTLKVIGKSSLLILWCSLWLLLIVPNYGYALCNVKDGFDSQSCKCVLYRWKVIQNPMLTDSIFKNTENKL